MNELIKGIYRWALRWSANEGLTLYGTLLYLKSKGYEYKVPELEWICQYIIRSNLVNERTRHGDHQKY